MKGQTATSEGELGTVTLGARGRAGRISIAQALRPNGGEHNAMNPERQHRRPGIDRSRAASACGIAVRFCSTACRCCWSMC